MKRILITGAKSYLGNAVEQYLAAYQAGDSGIQWQIDRISLRDNEWKQTSFAEYDTILHMAGIAHADIGNVSEQVKEEYYRVNRDLAEQTALKAKAEGVKQFIYMSSVIVYGDSAPVGRKKYITAEVPPSPANFYGDSKYQAEIRLQKLQEESFQVAIIRAPMIYGKGSRGNFPMLVKLGAKTPIFPAISNRRSMLYVENLAEFIRRLAESGRGGIFFPQNKEYVTTAEMVRLIGKVSGRRIRIWKVFNPLVYLASVIPGKIGRMTNKAFGSLYIDQKLSNREITDYQIYSLEESIKKSV